MLDILLNALMLLGIVVTVVLIAVALIAGAVLVIAIVGKVVDVWKSGKPKNGGR